MFRTVLNFSMLIPVFAHAGVMPWPSKMVAGSGGLIIDSSFSMAAQGYSDVRLQAAMRRFAARIARQTGLPMTIPKSPATLLIDCRAGGTEYPSLGEDESYRLDVSPEGARLQAETVTGALRGLETFAQLIVPGASGFEAGAVHIEDWPRFPWRGLMLDVSRHWMPIEVVARNLDAMASVKLNVFHWHLSDDQGFRVESKRFPRLQELGSDGNFYTQAEVRQVVAYARERGIRVIPEFDIPGHTTSWFAGYPKLASAPGPYSIERKWGIFEPTMDPSREETYTFLDGFLGEMAALFPDPFMHIGGDEILDAQWQQSASIQAFARRLHLATSRDLHAYFNRRVQELLRKHGKTMMGWDEIFDPGLGQDTVIQSWRGQASLADSARKGFRGILSYGYYLDHLDSASFYYANDPLGGPAGGLDPAQASRILGGEACMWTEYVDSDTVYSRIWPRAAAIAERLWSPREVADPVSMYTRMISIGHLLESAGVLERSNYGPMLDRIAGDRSSQSLRILADASEATGIQIRQAARVYTSQTPLNRFVDAVRPESESVFRLEQDAAKVIANPSPVSPELAELRVSFTEWAENDLRFEQLASEDALMIELLPVSRNLSLLGSVGLHALEYLQNGRQAPEAWIAQQRQAVDAMRKPVAEVTLAGIRPIDLLLQTLSSKNAHADARND